ncbi:MAG: hypothetical protein LAT55_07800 [Opitutales bacterium]|nr:hypothetical protein [Opitutales bacterium]
MNTATESYRTHPQLAPLFKEAESRHFKDDEFDLYLSVLPEEEKRVKAAREVKNVDGSIVKKIITKTYEIYPYEQKHQVALAKCIRDVRYVTAYATMSMLMDDVEWFRDKLLVWMKTIIQSFRYPDIPEGTTKRVHDDPEVLKHLQSLQPHQRSIYETYYGILIEMRQNLSPDAFTLMKPHLEMALAILAHD